MTIKNQLTTSLLILTAILLAACATKIIRGEAPIVRLSELNHADGQIELQLNMRNLNGVPMDVLSIDFSLTVKDKVLFSYTGPATTNIVANGTETWTVNTKENEVSQKLLGSLQAGEVKSLPYSLKGALTSSEDGKLKFENDGHLYPVPGRNGHFR